MRSAIDGRSDIRYSEHIPGTTGNYEWPVSFDYSAPGGFVGITQYDEDGKAVKDRVLLSLEQAKALVEFIQSRGRRV